MNAPSAIQITYPFQNEPNSLRSERAMAQKVFDTALKRELHDMMRQAKQMAKQIKEPTDV